MINQFIHSSWVTHHIILTKEEQCRSGDGSVPKHINACIKVVHRVASEDAKVKQACLFYQYLPTWKYSLPETYAETRKRYLQLH